MHRMRELLHQERSVHHLDFSPMKGILCVPLYTFIPLISNSRWPFLVTELIGSTEIHIFETFVFGSENRKR